MSLYGVGVKTKEVGFTDLFAWCHQEDVRSILMGVITLKYAFKTDILLFYCSYSE